MTQYTRLTRKTSASWIAGSIVTPVGEAAYRVQDLTLNIEQSDVVATNTFIGQYQTATNRPAGRFGIAAFTTELRGQGATAVPVAEGALLRACGFSEVSVGGTYAGYVYTLADLHNTADTPAGNMDPLDITINLDRMGSTVKNCVGNVSLNFIASQFPTMTFDLRGQVDSSVATATASSYADTAVPTITVGQQPVPWQDTEFILRGQTEITAYVTPATIVSATGTTKTFVFAGDLTDDFRRGSLFTITNSGTTNDGDYTIVSATYDGSTNTSVVVEETVVDETAVAKYGTLYKNYADGVIETCSIDIGLAVHPRPDSNASFGFNQPVLTAFDPIATMQIEANRLEVLKPWDLFLAGEVFDFGFTLNKDGGNGQEITVSMDVKINEYPVVVDNNGKYDITILLKQYEAATAPDKFKLTWKSEA